MTTNCDKTSAFLSLRVFLAEEPLCGPPDSSILRKTWKFVIC
jgi:hypothetical protein